MIRSEGWTRKEAALRAGISYNTATTRDRRNQGLDVTEAPRKYSQIRGYARDSLGDFDLFRRRYFGRLSTPWQAIAAHRLAELLASDKREFVVMNSPPGSGKSTLFTHDIPAWLTARNRALRGLIGSKSLRQAAAYTGRLRRSLGRRTIEQANPDLVARGRAFDGEAVLSKDFGTFRPTQGEVWTRNEFTVAQVDGEDLSEKEPTWTAFGMDSASLGWRVDYAVWDDVFDKSILRSVDAIERQQEWWGDEVETRIEPEGLLVLQGQRMANHDIYRFALDQVTEEFPDDDPDSEPVTAPLYVHIKYPAHDETKCEGNHGRLAKAWPDGCLLDPMRNSWTHLRNQQLKGDQKFRLLYQQEDIDVEGALVSPNWLEGGLDHNGIDSPGCWDDDRGTWQFPKGLSGRQILVATADPSAANYWAIELWLYHPETEQRFLIDLVRRKMTAPEFLDYNANDAEFHGVMHEWQTASKALGHPISHWIIEQNACQRWLLQYEHTKRWMAKMGVSVVGHETARNKSDPELGVQSIASHYRFGRVRLPGTREGRAVVAPMVKELTTYPEGLTDDCVMAHWFFEWNIAKLSKPRNEEPPKMKRPGWLTRSDRHWRAVAAMRT